MRKLVLGCVLVMASLGVGAPVWAASVTSGPIKGPPRAPVRLLVQCAPTTSSAAIQLRAASTSVPTSFDPSKNLLPAVAHAPTSQAGFFSIDVQVPIDASTGSYFFDAFCLDAGGTVIDGPASAAFEVAVLPLQVAPTQGSLGTKVTVTGGGCPPQSQFASVRIRGASDEVPFFDPEAPGQPPPAPVQPDGTFTLSFEVPSGLPLGENAIESFCTVQPAEGPLNPVAGPGFAVFVATGLAPTGSGAGTLPAVAVVLLVVGVVVLRAGRRTAGGSSARSRPLTC